MNDYNDAFNSFVNLDPPFLLWAVIGEFGVHSAGYCLSWLGNYSFFAMLHKISLGWCTVYKNRYQVGDRGIWTDSNPDLFLWSRWYGSLMFVLPCSLSPSCLQWWIYLCKLVQCPISPPSCAVMWLDLLFVSSYILAVSCLWAVPGRHTSVSRGPQSFLLKKMKSENRILVCGVYTECVQAGCVMGHMVANPQWLSAGSLNLFGPMAFKNFLGKEAN